MASFSQLLTDDSKFSAIYYCGVNVTTENQYWCLCTGYSFLKPHILAVSIQKIDYQKLTKGHQDQKDFGEPGIYVNGRKEAKIMV